jgi:ABC-type transport system involved in multi-copper enzyme maturation permease subunit
VEAKHSRNNLLTGFLFLVMIGGAVLMMTWPVWLAPPNVASTFLVYLVLMLLWFPLLIIAVLRGYRGPFLLMIGLGIVLIIVALAVGGPNISTLGIDPKDCTSKEIFSQQMEYTCKRFAALGSAQETYIFQGSAGSGFAVKVSDTTIYPP